VPAQRYGVPVRLKNTMDEKASGTLISDKGTRGEFKAVAAKDGITAIKIKSSRMLLAYGFLRKVFEIFEKYKTPIDMVSTSEVAVSVTVDSDQFLPQIEEELKSFGSIEVDRGQTIICIVGNMLAEKEAVLKQVFSSLAGIKIRMVSFGGSNNNISILLETAQKDKALNLLNEGLFGITG
jgi:aspartate kinase